MVGGCVRDLLRSTRNLDIDVLIAGDGIAFAQALAQREGDRVTTQARFGTAVVQFPEGYKIDVATARTADDTYPPTLRAMAQSSLQQDLSRRDFTINTLAIQLNTQHFGELLDFYGGQRDLKDKTLRVLHSLSFMDDPIRVFRAIRFAVHFGFHIGKETLRLLKGAVSMDFFRRLSGPRLGTEIRLLLGEPKAHKAVSRLAELDLLRFLHPEVVWSPQLGWLLQNIDDTLAWYRLASLHWPDHAKRPGRSAEALRERVEPWLVRFMALTDALSDVAVRDVLQRLSISRRQADTVYAARLARHAIPRLATRPPLPPAEMYRLLTGQQLEVLLFLLAKTSSDVAKHQIVAYLDTSRFVKSRLSGHDLHAMGLTPGPRFRQVLDRVLAARLNGEVTNDAEERALVQQLMRTSL
jgi:tRNA nucleotidyltransferase (CCA-adding enzyme)